MKFSYVEPRVVLQRFVVDFDHDGLALFKVEVFHVHLLLDQVQNHISSELFDTDRLVVVIRTLYRQNLRVFLSLVILFEIFKLTD